MKLQIKTRYIALGIIIVLTGLFLFGWHLGHKKAESLLNDVISTKNKEIETYVIELKSRAVYLTQVEQEVQTLKEAKKEGLIDREALKALNIKQTAEISKLKIQIDTLLENIDHSGEIVVVYDTITEIPKNALLLPFTFEKHDPWLDLSGSLSSQATLDISLGMSLEIDAVSGIEKKTKAPILSITTDNPYINIIGVRSYKTDIPKIKRYGLGIQFGFGASKMGLSPYVGFGVHYSLIRF